MTNNKFWQIKKPKDFSAEEWESICTHCGKCCLIKLQNEDTDDVFYTNVICRYHDCKTNLCKQYTNRCSLVPTCLKLTPQNINKLFWIPETCAYRILFSTGNLPEWHPLVIGKALPEEFKIPTTVVSELSVSEDELEDYIIEDENDD